VRAWEEVGFEYWKSISRMFLGVLLQYFTVYDNERST
jgi:hypothetical protein